MKYLTRTVWLLGLTSLFTDFASEMLYPVMPMFLQSIGFSVAAIGLLEGIAEAVASLGKGYFGRMSDGIGRRVPFVRAGYALSAVSKPLMALFANVPGVYAARTTDRIGKGMRTAARDALLSSECSPETKGRVFGFHRGMDTLGAAIGPFCSLLFLSFCPGQYRSLFLLAFIPGVFAVAFTLLVKEKSIEPRPRRGGFFEFLKYWPQAPAQYRTLVIGLVAFALINSSDVFLLLAMKSKGLTDRHVIGAYIFYNIIYAALSFPIGALGDRVGLQKMLVAGFVLFAVVYAGFAKAESVPVFLALLFLYGLYAACTEGVAKALISNLVPKTETATAIGLLTSLQGIAALLASTVAGVIWQTFSPQATFLISAAGALAVAAWLAIKVPAFAKATAGEPMNGKRR